ncbi:hypothetical protein BDN70DRAFT_815973 [Pholiota conissans]|uniref:Uncharacterized protein n=1 Tax=Pholiota conissans TaxID=109636 RepID=A0A9P5YQY9_9AGAR|nr:hypothetical protein BDN70DRAFT_815973 [Pholiota conissans]
MEWEVARWAKLRGPGSTAFSELLEIDGVVESLGLSFKNTAELHKIVDKNIPAKRPAFTKQEALVGGAKTEIYARDVLECIKALYGDPQHARYLVFAPERHYADADKTQQLYHDMHTGKWWWDTQKSLENLKEGATIIPIILSSDKTQVTLFRNKTETAYPVYLTIGNLPKSIRRKPSRQGQILLAYLPTSRLLHISNKAARRRTQSNLFHACMTYILSPLQAAGVDGIRIVDGNGVARRGHPIIAVYVGDYPEQILVTGGFTGDCPKCDCPHAELGEYPCDHPRRNLQAVHDALDQLGDPGYATSCRDANIKPIQHPFWENLPYVDIFQSITPDILHQLHQGVVKHLIAWLRSACSDSVIDERVQRLPPNHSIRSFKKGITFLSRVSGTEHRQISSLLIGLLIDVQLPDGISNQPLIAATRAILDFLYLAQYPVHTTETLLSLDQALQDFHDNKHIFETLGIRHNFNLPKLHSMVHYVRSIKLFGTTDNYNTEATERLHIDFAKDAYQATNHKDEFTQMTKWLERQEKIAHHANYAAWRRRRIEEGHEEEGEAHCSWQPPDMACDLHPKMTKHPTHKSVPLSTIVSREGYGATSFVPALCRFIAQFRNPRQTRGQIEAAAVEIHLPFHSLPVFHRVKFWNPDIHGTETLDSIHAHPARISDSETLAESRFDTALISVKKGGREGGCEGTRVGQVRVIFSLPESCHRSLFPSGIAPPRHLVYIEWFSRFTRRPDPILKMYKVSRALLTDGNRVASIVPVSLLQRSVHLFPKWGRDRERYLKWSADTVLEECDTFYLNSFKDRHTYYNVY